MNGVIVQYNGKETLHYYNMLRFETGCIRTTSTKNLNVFLDSFNQTECFHRCGK